MSSLVLRYRESLPAPDLRQWVECYWSCRGFVTTTFARPVLPDGCMDVLVSDEPGRAGTRVVGTQRRAAPVTLEGPVSVFGIRFRPGGLPAFVPMHARELVDRTTLLDEVVEAGTAALFSPLGDAPIQDRPRLADGVLRGRLAAVAPDRFVARALAALSDGSGAPGVRAIASALGMSRRTLERRFLAAIGIGPGALGRILRFRRASDRMAARPDLELGRIAHEMGYADQSHFSRDVRDLTGATAGQLRMLYWQV